MRVKRVACLTVVLTGYLLLPAAARAQSVTAGNIGGTARDTTGAVLPGVTVEASSPALIEKVRSVVTDAAGQYLIVDLRPGTYTVTFTLPGFATLKREGLQLTTGFTASVNVDMQPGAVEESLTVTGETPVVDVQQVKEQRTLTRKAIEALPIAGNQSGLIALTPGAVDTSTSPTRDVGGSSGDRFGQAAIHGSRADGATLYDGLSLWSLKNTWEAAPRRIAINEEAVQEIALQTSGISAEIQTGGIATNIVPKDGSNTFHGDFNFDYTGNGLQSDNVSSLGVVPNGPADALPNRGVTVGNKNVRIFDVGVDVGGPIVNDRLWFFTAPRRWAAEYTIAGAYYNLYPHTLFFANDLSKPVHAWTPATEPLNGRITWQAAAKHRFTVNFIDENNCLCRTGTSATRNVETAYTSHLHEALVQPSWTYPVNNKLLIEAGLMWRLDNGQIDPNADSSDGFLPTDRAVQELSINKWYGSLAGGGNPTLPGGAACGFLSDLGFQLSKYTQTRFSMSYVTGSHAFKVGFTTVSGYLGGDPNHPNGPNYDEAYVFRNQVPVGLYELAGPSYQIFREKLDLGAFVQDQWTKNRLTLNIGGRFDYLNAYNPAQTRPAGEYTAQFNWPEQDCVPCWKDFEPRLGGSYDLFGTGKTVLKAFIGRYVLQQNTAIAQKMNSSLAIAGTTFRNWTPTPAHLAQLTLSTAPAAFVPNCDLHNPLVNGECGQIDNLAFGTPTTVTTYDPSYLTGWGKREYTWQGSVLLQHELMPGTAATIGYYRTVYGDNQLVTHNQAVTPQDYSQFCVTAPSDPRLPGGGGGLVCDYDINPGKLGQVKNLVTYARNFGNYSEHFDGADFNINSRFGRGGLLFGGVSLGRTVVDDCFVVDNPGEAPAIVAGQQSGTPIVINLCRSTNWQNQLRLAGSYPLPWWGLEVSAKYQNFPGINRMANFVATNAQVLQSLGRNLGSCGFAAVCNANTQALDLISPNGVREPRQSQLDFRLSTTVRFGKIAVQPKFDIYNLLNAADVLGVNSRYSGDGAALWNATGILAARTFKFGARVTF